MPRDKLIVSIQLNWTPRIPSNWFDDILENSEHYGTKKVYRTGPWRNNPDYFYRNLPSVDSSRAKIVLADRRISSSLSLSLICTQAISFSDTSNLSFFPHVCFAFVCSAVIQNFHLLHSKRELFWLDLILLWRWHIQVDLEWCWKWSFVSKTWQTNEPK